ncbi:hypothetical protein ACLM5H_20815 [Fredinandcohnia humi]
MEHYYLKELNFDELNEYRKTDYRSLTLYKIIIKEFSSDYTKNQPAISPIYDILNLQRTEDLPLKTEDGLKVLTFLALGNNELPIDLRFVKKDVEEMLRIKINPVSKSIQVTTLIWNKLRQKYITSGNEKGSNSFMKDPAVVNLLERIYIGTEDHFGLLYFPRKRVK